MQIGNILISAGKPISSSSTAKKISIPLEPDFLRVESESSKATNQSAATKTEYLCTKESNPLEIYQRMTGRTILSGTFFAPGSKSLWSDEQLSSLIGKGTTIDTTKTINWASNGEKKLSEEQIAYLKKKYDVTNLTSQEYYDLMSDLTRSEERRVGKEC